MRSYSVSRLSYFLPIAILIFILLIFGGIVLLAPEGPNVQTGTPMGQAFMLLLLLYGIYKTLATPHTVQLASESTLQFRSAFGTSTGEIAQLKKITTESMGNFVSFQFVNKKIRMNHHIDGLHKLLAELKSRNTQLEITGL